MSGKVETSQAEPDLTALESFLVGNQDLERLAVSSAPVPCRDLGIALRLNSRSNVKEGRRADSNRLLLLITSDQSGVAGVYRGLQMPHI
jgi:hypothetical protein